MTADQRLRRLLALIPWIEAEGSAPVDEVCARFGFTEEELQEDLGLLFLCGIHPYSPGDLIDAQIEDGRVSIRYADWFRRPLRLTPAQGLVLVTSAEALLSVPGTDRSGPLARALEKVATVVGVAPGDAPAVALGEADESVLAIVKTAVEDRTRVVIDHYSVGSDGWLQRTVDPWIVFSDRGVWYLRGWCHLTEAVRVFRLDRVRAASSTDEPFVPPADVGGSEVYERRADDPVVVIDVAPSARWVAVEHPNDGVTELEDGWLRIALPVSEPHFLEQLLLGLGAAARVVEAPEALRDAGPAAAARILDRYR